VGPGERLPSTRDLAEQLSVSRTVILLAYDQLLAEGFLTGRAGSGTYVSEIMSGARGVISESPARVRLSRFGQCAVGAESEVDFPGRVPRSFRYDFSYRRSAVEGFPFEAWRRILMRRARSAPPRSFDYGPPAGSPALCDAISAHLRRSRAVVCDGSQIIIVNGSQQALDLAARVLLERGDRVAIEDPQYQGAREIFRAAGALLRPIPVDREGLDAAKLPKRARIAFVTPSHQFPTGAILPLSRRLALLEWAKRADAMIIEDDYDGEFRYEGQPVESLQGLDTEGRVIYVGTFSRTIFPALRLGYLVVPKSLVSAFTAAKWLCDRHTATLDQETLAEFIGSGAYHRHLRRARHENTMRRDVLLDAIHRYLRNRVALTGEGAGAHVVLWTRGRETEEATISSAASLGVGIYGISRYFLTRSSRVGLMLGYSSMKEEDIRQGIRQLGRVIH
jgi:GntR family transcriptional regulator/MocR family aminotransferase